MNIQKGWLKADGCQLIAGNYVQQIKSSLGMEDRPARHLGKLAETRSAQDDVQPCHVRGGDWQRHHHRASF